MRVIIIPLLFGLVVALIGLWLTSCTTLGQPIYPCGQHPKGAIECYDHYGRIVTPRDSGQS